ncbi:hypothetical protein [uncultured Methanoregula sp.]|uniref:hypothetical protein n=1 Tax=uncultured Methanoregula sp. TaxID=1005933 RepID=UPI003749F46C
MIYDISKLYAVNSHQILSTYLDNTTTSMEIKVIVAAGSGSEEYGGYGKPITYTLFKRMYTSITDEKVKSLLSDRIKANQTAIKKLENELAKEMKKKNSSINLKIPELRTEINSLKQEYLQLQNPDSNIVKKLMLSVKNQQKDTDKSAKTTYNKFLQYLSDPEFHNSKDPVDFTQIL